MAAFTPQNTSFDFLPEAPALEEQAASSSSGSRPAKRQRVYSNSKPSLGRKIVPYQRWNERGSGKITDFDKIPAGWDPSDRDIDEEFVYITILCI